jgi:exonuclease III
MLTDSTPPSKDCLANWIKKEDPTICCLQETHLIDRNKHFLCLSIKGWKIIFQANGPRKQTGVAILTSEKVDFKPKLVRRDKEGHFILIKGAIHQEEVTMINLYATNGSAPNFIKHTLMDLKSQTDPTRQ